MRTFEQLNEKFGPLIREEWSQHANGGGWKHKSANVAETVFLDALVVVLYGNAQIYGNARISGNAQIYGNAQISGNARIYGNAQISGNARIYGNAQISGNARISGNAQIYGDAWISGNAQISGDAWKKSPLYLLDSRSHGASNCKHGFLRIGCEEHSFAEWKKRFPAIARKHSLTTAEKKEYKAIIELFCKIGL